jgi:hypothetical protein
VADERADRLRDRRRKQRDRVESGEAESEGTAESDETDKPSKPDEPSKTEGSESVKESQVPQYMYLPEGQQKRLKREFRLLQADWEVEFQGERGELEKNRHYFPLVLKYGLDRVSEWDVQTVKNRLDDMEDTS